MTNIKARTGFRSGLAVITATVVSDPIDLARKHCGWVERIFFASWSNVLCGKYWKRR